MQFKIKYKKWDEYKEWFVEAWTFFYALEKIYSNDNPDFSECNIDNPFMLLSIELDKTIIIR